MIFTRTILKSDKYLLFSRFFSFFSRLVLSRTFFYSLFFFSHARKKRLCEKKKTYGSWKIKLWNFELYIKGMDCQLGHFGTAVLSIWGDKFFFSNFEEHVWELNPFPGNSGFQKISLTGKLKTFVKTSKPWSKLTYCKSYHQQPSTIFLFFDHPSPQRQQPTFF